MKELMRTHNVQALIIAAPPRTLAELRHAFPPSVQKHIIAEIDKDLTKHPISEIERHIFG
jgi:protein required for attachment to host cells